MPPGGSPAAVHLLLRGEGSVTASKRTPVGQVRRLICEISGLDRMTWRIQENSKVLGTQEGDNLPAKGTQSQTANQIAQALTGY